MVDLVYAFTCESEKTIIIYNSVSVWIGRTNKQMRPEPASNRLINLILQFYAYSRGAA